MPGSKGKGIFVPDEGALHFRLKEQVGKGIAMHEDGKGGLMKSSPAPSPSLACISSPAFFQSFTVNPRSRFHLIPTSLPH